MLLGKTKIQQRCLKYIEARAQELKVDYDLSDTNSNRHLLVLVWDLCSKYEANPGDVPADVMQQACDELLIASIVSVLQGVNHPEPPDIEHYQTLFNTAIGRLDMRDVPYVPIRPCPIELEWELSTDDDSILKLQPNVQLTIPFAEMGTESSA